MLKTLLLASVTLHLCLGIPVAQKRDVSCSPTDGWNVALTFDNPGGGTIAVDFLYNVGTEWEEGFKPTEEEAEEIFSAFAEELGWSCCLHVAAIHFMVGYM